MKRLRLFILILMTLLLPIRGAVAAAMLCPGAIGAASAAATAGHDHHAMHAGHSMQSMTDQADPHAGHHAPASTEPSASCHFCASDCCMASIVGSVPSLEQASVSAALTFPALSAPVPAFHSEGQERPPRTV